MKLAVIGVGLIGGSFALGARAAGLTAQVTGFDRDHAALQRAEQLGVVDRVARSPAEAARDADLILIATPVGATKAMLGEIAASLSATAVVTDVGSTKADAVASARHTLGEGFPRFVPGHPIAGGERPGVEHAAAALFRDKLFISTPQPEAQPAALEAVESIWRALGCRVERMDATEHDRIFAAVSHLPHLLAYALVAQIAGEADAARKFGLAGAGFRDFTRIAASSPEMWRDICVANRVQLGAELTRYRQQLADLQAALDSADAASLDRVFSVAAQARRARPPLLDAD
jgi:prephenate dehydrogenase